MNGFEFDLRGRELLRMYYVMEKGKIVLHMLFKAQTSLGHDEIGFHIVCDAIKESVNGVLLNA